MKKISTTTAKKFRKMQKLTFGFRTEAANQVAAPAETRNTQLAASIDANRLFLIIGAETLIRKMQKLTFGFRTEAANQVAAPAETRNTQLAASIDANRLFLIIGAETLI